MWEKLDAVRALLAHGADVGVKDAKARTAEDTAGGRLQGPLRALLRACRQSARPAKKVARKKKPRSR